MKYEGVGNNCNFRALDKREYLMIILLISHQYHICYDPSSKPSCQDGSDEWAQHMFLCRIDKNYPLLSPNTLKCLSIGTPKTINFPFVSNWKLMVFRCPNIQTHYNEAVIYLNFGTLKNNEFSIWNKWKIYYFLVSQYLRHIRVLPLLEVWISLFLYFQVPQLIRLIWR